jgi:uncharacterized protein YegL
MKTRKTIYHLIVDKSGSMCDCIESTINGFNEQVNKIKSNAHEFQEEEITMGLTLFNDYADHHYFLANPSTVQLLNANTYRPNGNTALMDAVGETVNSIENQLRESHIPATVVVVILTDGYENASKSYNLVKIRNMISRLEETGKWTFSFIGATLDAVAVAESMAIKNQNSFAFEKKNMKSAVWDKLGKSMSMYFYNKSENKNTDNFF